MAGPSDKTQIEYVLGLDPKGVEAALKRLSDQLKSFDAQLKTVGTTLGGRDGPNQALRKIEAGTVDARVTNAVAKGVKNNQKAMDNTIISELSKTSASDFTNRLRQVTRKNDLKLYQEALDRNRSELQQQALQKGTRAKPGAISTLNTLQEEINEQGRLIAMRARAGADYDRAYKQAQRENVVFDQKAEAAKRAAKLETVRLESEATQKSIEAANRLNTKKALEPGRVINRAEDKALSGNIKAESALRIEQAMGDAYLRARAELGRLNVELARQRDLQKSGRGNLDDLKRAEQAVVAQRKEIDRLKEAKRQAANQPLMSPQDKADLGIRSRLDAARKMLPEIRQLGVERALGDGGASLFKIQAGLMQNYILMGQVFNLISFGTQFVIELDKAFYQLQAIAGATDGTMMGLRDTIKEVGSQTKFSAVEVAQAAVVMAQAGFSAAQIDEAIGKIAMFATATGSELEPAVDLVTSTMSVFNMRAEEAGTVVNVLTGALNLSKLTIEKLTLGLQYAGNTAMDAGVGFTELTTVLAALSNQGIRSGSTMGTGLRQIIVDLINPSQKLVSELSSVGLTLEDVDVRTKGLIGVLQKMKAAGFGVENAFAGMEVRAASAYAAIVANADGLQVLQRELLLSNAAMEATEAQSNSLAVIGSKFVNAGGVAIDNLTKNFQKIAAVLLKTFTDLFQWINRNAEVARILGTAFLTIGFTKVAANILSLIANLISLASVTTTATVATTALGRSLSILGKSSVIGVLLGIGVAVFDMLGGFESAADKVDDVQTKLDAARGAFESTKEAIDSVQEKITEINSRYDTLTKGSEELETQTAEVRIRFEELGLQLPPLVTGANQLTNALGNLLTQLRQIAAQDLSIVISDLHELLRVQARVVLNKGAELPSDLESVFATGTLTHLATGIATYVPGSVSEADRSSSQKAFEEVKALSLSFSNASRSGDKDAISQIGNEVISRSLGLIRSLQKISEALDPNSTQASQIEAANLSLRSLIADVQKVQVASIQIVSAEREQLVMRTDAENRRLQEIRAGQDELERFYLAQDITSSEMTDQEKAAALRARKAAAQQRQADEKRFLESMTPEEADLYTSTPTYRKLTTTLATAVTSIDKLLTGTAESIKETDKIVTSVLESRISRLKRDRDNEKEGSGKYRELTEQIVTAVEDSFKVRIDNAQRDLETLEGQGKGKSVAAQAQREFIKELEFQMKSEVDDVRAGKQGAGRVARAAEEVRNEIVDLFQSWEDAISEAKIARDDRVGRAKDALATLDEGIQAAEATGKYSSIDLEYAKRETLKVQRIASLKEELAAQQDLVAVIRTKFDADQRAIQAEVDRTRAAMDAAQTLAEQKDATSQYKAAKDKLRKATEELTDAERKERSIRAALNGETGEATLRTLDLADSLGYALKFYLDDNGGNLQWVDYLKTNLPDIVNTAGGAFKTFFKTLADGSASAGDAFKTLASSIIESLLDIAAQYAAMQIFKALLGSLGIGGSSGNMFSSDGWMPMKMGGIVGRPSAMGNIVRGHYPRDSVLTPTMPGEGILTESATRMLGEGTIDRLNALGNRTVNDGSRSARYQGEKKEPAITNIWVIPPDAPRPTSKQDIVVALQDTIARDGSTKKLIRSVVRGEA